MSDPRWTDPRYNDPVLRQSESVGGVWGWIAGLSVLALIAFMIIAGWNSNPNTAHDNTQQPPVTTGSVPRTPPSTTGSGTMSPQPTAPTTAPINRGAQ